MDKVNTNTTNTAPDKTLDNSPVLEGEIVKRPKVSHKPTKLTYRQKKFIKSYIETGNATKSAKLAGYSAHTAHVQGSTLLHNPKVLAILNDSVEEAEGVIRELMHSNNEEIRLKSAKETLDRTIGKPIQRSESVSVNITVESMLGTSDNK